MRKISFLLSCLIFSATGFSQTGPGGVGNSSSNVIWYDIDRMGAANGDSLSSITDFSGNGNSATSFGSFRPSVISDHISNRDVINFAGGGFVSTGAISDLDNPTGITEFFLGNITGDGIISMIRYAGSGIQNEQAFSTNVANFGNSFQSWAPTSTGVTTDFFFPLGGSYQSHFAWRESSDSLHGSIAGIGFFNSPVLNANGTPGAHSNLMLGARTTDTLNFMNGDIAEYILFNFALNPAQIRIVQSYLRAKYSSTLYNGVQLYVPPATHVNDIAGIGQENANSSHTRAHSSVLRVSNPDALAPGDYVMYGHQNGNLSTTTSGTPGSYNSSGSVLSRNWYIDETNDVGQVRIVFDLSSVTVNGTPDDNSYDLLLSTTTNFSGASIVQTATRVGDSVVFTNVNLTDDRYITLGNKGFVSPTNQFYLSGDWSNGANWLSGIPSDSTYITEIVDFFAFGTSCIVSGDESTFNLSLEPNTRIRINTGASLTIKGNLLMLPTSEFLMEDGSELIFRGTGTDYDTILNNTGDTLSFNNVRIAGTQGLFIPSGNDITLNGGLSLNSADLEIAPGATFTFDASASSQPAVVNVGGDGNINGDIIFERIIDTRDASWATLSAPVTNTDIEDMDNEIYMSGIVGADGAAGNTIGGNFISVWYWDAINDQYVAVGNTNEAMPSGRGYEVWLADDLVQYNGGIIDFRGGVDMSEIELSLSSTGGGWNLVGNPYPAFLDWTLVSAGVTTISGDEFWIYDYGTSQYVNRGDGNVIPPCQGFWVHSTGSILTLTPTADLSNTNSTTFYKNDNAQRPELSLKLKGVGGRYEHTAFVRSNENALSSFDEMDQTMLKSPDTLSCEIGTIADQNLLLVNYLNQSEEKLSIPFQVRAGKPGEYSVKIDGLDNFGKYECISLYDPETEKIETINDGHSFKVKLQKNAPKLYVLQLNSIESDCEETDLVSNTSFTESVSLYSDGESLTINYMFGDAHEVDVVVYDITGKQILNSSHVAEQNQERIDLSYFSSGIYMVRLTFDQSHSLTEKVYINKP